jgi:predicted outer membrane repeat protein
VLTHGGSNSLGYGNRFTVSLGNGDGTFTAQPYFTTGGSVNRVVVGDFNEDGNQDAAFMTHDWNAVTIHWGNGLGGFSGSSALDLGARNGFDLLACDLNQDGHLDLAVVMNDLGNVKLFLGAGNGTFTLAPNTLAVPAGRGIQAGDFNEDGLPDLAVVNDPASVYVFIASGGATFLPGQVFPAVSGAQMLDVADFDQDGHLDIAVGNSGGNDVALLHGDGWGGFAAPRLVASGANNVGVLRVADFDQNGLPDLVATSSQTPTGAAVLNARTADVAEVVVTVRNVAPAVYIDGPGGGLDTTLDAGDRYTAGGWFTDPGADDWIATVDYGAGGGAQPLAVNPDKSFELDHQYSTPGMFPVTVSVTDDDGGVGTDTVIVAVAEAPSLVVTTVGDVVDRFDGLTSLREAIAYANSRAGEDTVTFDGSLMGTTIELALGQLDLTDSTGTTTIQGLGADQLTIDGNHLSRVFNVATGVTVEVSGLTITAGSDSDGGGILNAGTLTLRDCTVSDNSSSGQGGGIFSTGPLTLQNCTVTNNASHAGPQYVDGGGIHAENGPLTILDSTISNNSAFSGGGVGTVWIPQVLITGSVIRDNTTVVGAGGIYFAVSSGTIADTTISGNVAASTSYAGGGGAIKNDNNSHLTLDRVTLSGNSTGSYGGGVFTIHDSTVVATNTTIVGNTAGTRGGGLATVWSSAMTLTNSTVGNNAVTSGVGGGVYLEGGNQAPIGNTIVAGNAAGSGPDVAGVVSSLGHNLIGNTANSSGWQSSDLLDANPLLGPLGDYGGPTQTMALLPGSPAIDAGDNSVLRSRTSAASAGWAPWTSGPSSRGASA